jgi:hypothetical protein
LAAATKAGACALARIRSASVVGVLLLVMGP